MIIPTLFPALQHAHLFNSQVFAAGTVDAMIKMCDGMACSIVVVDMACPYVLKAMALISVSTKTGRGLENHLDSEFVGEEIVVYSTELATCGLGQSNGTVEGITAKVMLVVKLVVLAAP